MHNTKPALLGNGEDTPGNREGGWILPVDETEARMAVPEPWGDGYGSLIEYQRTGTGARLVSRGRDRARKGLGPNVDFVVEVPPG